LAIGGIEAAANDAHLLNAFRARKKADMTAAGDGGGLRRDARLKSLQTKSAECRWFSP